MLLRRLGLIARRRSLAVSKFFLQPRLNPCSRHALRRVSFFGGDIYAKSRAQKKTPLHGRREAHYKGASRGKNGPAEKTSRGGPKTRPRPEAVQERCPEARNRGGKGGDALQPACLPSFLGNLGSYTYTIPPIAKGAPCTHTFHKHGDCIASKEHLARLELTS